MNLDLTDKKIYIEAGANNGVDQSRSLAFMSQEDYVGILIEPHPPTFAKCVHNRNNGRTLFVNCALVSEDYKESTIGIHTHQSWSLMNCVSDSIMRKESPEEYSTETFSVPARTLQSILDELNITDVEYLFLDVEGYELEVLGGINHKTTIKKLELEQHMKSDYDKERNIIIEACDKINLHYEGQWSDQGHPKLHFINHEEKEGAE